MSWTSGVDGKGSRDPFVENWQQYGQRALSEYLLKNYTDYDNRDPFLNYGSYSSVRGSDPLGIIQDPARLSAFFDPITARYDELAMRSLAGLDGLNYGVETEPNRTFTPTRDEVQRFIDRQYADYMAAGNPGNDAMWLPTLQGDRVVYGQRNSGNGGILDKITEVAERGFALSGLAPLTGLATGTDFLTMLGGGTGALGAGAAGGAMDMGVGGVGEAMGIGGGTAASAGAGGLVDPSWGVNPTGAFTPGSYSPSDPLGLGTTAASPITNTAPLGEFTASQLPGGALNPFGTATLGTGAAVIPAITTTPPMPPAQAELPSNNATPGEVTGATGTNNPVTAGALGTSGAAAAGAAGASSLVNWLSQATGLSPAALQAMGILGAAGLNWVGQNNYSDALTNIANQARSDRQPFLNKSLEWMNNPSSYMEGVGKPALDATLRALSVQGNPFGSPTSLAIAGDIANRNWQNAVTGFGNIGLSGEDSRNTLLAGSANADRGALAGVGSAFGQLTSPNSLEDILRRYQFPGVSLP